MKKYVIFTMKRFIPLFAVTFAVCFSIFMMYFSSMTITYTTYSGGGYYLETLDSGIIVVSIPLAILTSILPIFANSYRYRLRAADVFYQIGKGKKSIRFVNNLSLLSAALISFTVAFIFGLFILAARQIPFIGKESVVSTYTYINEYGDTAVGYTTQTYVLFNFVYYLPVYLILIVAGLINYFISYFLVTRSNNLVNSIITLLLGQLVLGIGIMSPFWYVNIYTQIISAINGDYYSILTEVFVGTHTSTIVSPIAWTHLIFNGLITTNGSAIANIDLSNLDSSQILSIVLSSICTLGYIVAGIVGLLYFLKEPESSGEYSGKPVGRDKYQIIIFHIGFGIIGLWVGAANSVGGVLLTFVGIVSLISQFIFFGAMYFVFMGLLRRNFRLNLKELLIMLGSLTINLILGLVMTLSLPQITI